jgi:hypothetical protein
MSKRKLYCRSTYIPIIFLSLIMFALTNVPDILFTLTNENVHELDSINLVERNLSTISFI